MCRHVHLCVAVWLQQRRSQSCMPNEGGDGHQTRGWVRGRAWCKPERASEGGDQRGGANFTDFYFLKLENNLIDLLFVCMDVVTQVSGHVWGSKDNLWERFSPPTLWVPQMRLRLSGLVASAFYPCCWPIKDFLILEPSVAGLRVPEKVTSSFLLMDGICVGWEVGCHPCSCLGYRGSH